MTSAIRPRVLVIDNYDSFTWNLVQQLGALGADPLVYRNDAITVAEAEDLAPDRLLISPGPGTPEETGVTFALLDAFAGRLPILGVCLGHQAIARWLGADVVRAGRIMHGKTSRVRHDGRGLFAGLPTPLTVARYHSLLVDPTRLPPALEPVAWTDDPGHPAELMGLTVPALDLHGVQFHPESFLTHDGDPLIARFLAGACAIRAVPA